MVVLVHRRQKIGFIIVALVEVDFPDVLPEAGVEQVILWGLVVNTGAAACAGLACRCGRWARGCRRARGG
jgi:hypothetical protein